MFGFVRKRILFQVHRQDPHVPQTLGRGGQRTHPEVSHRAPRPQQREHRRLQQQKGTLSTPIPAIGFSKKNR